MSTAARPSPARSRAAARPRRCGESSRPARGRGRVQDPVDIRDDVLHRPGRHQTGPGTARGDPTTGRAGHQAAANRPRPRPGPSRGRRRRRPRPVHASRSRVPRRGPDSRRRRDRADCRRIRTVAALADGLAGSPQETRLRLLIRSDIPDPVARHRIRDGEQFVARVDFGWPELRLALEYDGTRHGEAGQFRGDRQRLNGLTAAGWAVLSVTAADLRRPDLTLARIGGAVASRSRPDPVTGALVRGVFAVSM